MTTTTTQAWHTTADSTLGPLTLVRDDDGIRGVYFRHHWHRPSPDTFGPAVDDGFAEVTRQLHDYLAGTRRTFDLPMHAAGDDFQHRVWDELATIPYGATTTYGELATRIGGATAQEIGAAVGRNPLSILVPCHRVLGRGGALTGYAGGLARKRALLDLEAAHTPSGQPALW